MFCCLRFHFNGKIIVIVERSRRIRMRRIRRRGRGKGRGKKRKEEKEKEKRGKEEGGIRKEEGGRTVLIATIISIAHC